VRAAASLQRQIQQAMRVLQTEAVRSAYGSRDTSEIVERVAALELGHVPNTVRYRTAAQAGGTIIRWLATRAHKLSSRASVIDARDLRRQSKSPTPLTTPTDRDLVDACEQWLAVGGVADDRVDRRAQPVETPDAQTLSVVRPAVRGLLESSRAFSRLPPAEQKALTRRTVKVAAFMATPHRVRGVDLGRCERDDASWWRLQDVDFPAFVAELVKGVFNAIVDSSIEQMHAYGDLVKNVEQCVDAFAHDAVTDGAARRWLTVRYPDALAVTFVAKKAGRLTVVAEHPEAALGTICADLCLRERSTKLHDGRQEVELVRRARRRIARNRQQLLASIVLLGSNRIVTAKR
jgi:hypothetical protein